MQCEVPILRVKDDTKSKREVSHMDRYKPNETSSSHKAGGEVRMHNSDVNREGRTNPASGANQRVHPNTVAEVSNNRTADQRDLTSTNGSRSGKLEDLRTDISLHQRCALEAYQEQRDLFRAIPRSGTRYQNAAECRTQRSVEHYDAEGIRRQCGKGAQIDFIC